LGLNEKKEERIMASELQETLNQLGAHYREHGGEGSQPFCNQASEMLEKNFQEQRVRVAQSYGAAEMCEDPKLGGKKLCNRAEGTSRCRKRKDAGRCTPQDLAACAKKNKTALLPGYRKARLVATA